jgi:alpha-D-ribose 1-methylphosphonate 5-triphosphate synthase subunit PhnG
MGSDMTDVIDRDYVLCECDLEALKGLIDTLEEQYEPRLIQKPTPCLTMLRAEDSIEGQEFYLGEAMTSECEVAVGDETGYGVCVGEEPERAYCLAVVDAVIAHEKGMPEKIEQFLADHDEKLAHAERVEFAQVMRTQVDFKLFDEE